MKTETIEERIVTELIDRQLTVTTAESCTGGLLGATLVNVPGVSEVYKEGYITYSDEAKEKLLEYPQRPFLTTEWSVNRLPKKWQWELPGQQKQISHFPQREWQDRMEEVQNIRWARYTSAVITGEKPWESVSLERETVWRSEPKPYIGLWNYWKKP